MKKMNKTVLAFALGFGQLSAATAADYYIPGAIYITGGGGVAGLFNSDWKLSDDVTAPGELEQPQSEENGVATVLGAMGYRFDKVPLRAEVTYRWYDTAEYTWNHLFNGRELETGHGRIDSQAVLFSLYLEWRNSTGFVPFIGGGVGGYFNNTHFERRDITTPVNSTIGGTSHDNFGFAWSASAGLMYIINEHWFIDVRADYVGLGKADFYEDTLTAGTHELMHTEDLYAISGLINLTVAYDIF